MRSEFRNSKPKEYWLRTVLLFPWRSAVLLAKSGLVLGLLTFLLIVLYTGLRSLLPMGLEDARGMRYVDFIGERVEAIRAIPDDSDACYRSSFILLPIYVLRTSGIPALIAVYDPGGTIDLWLQENDYNYAFLLPQGEPTYLRILPMYWEAVERASWAFLVNGVAQAKPCSSVRMVDHDYRVNKK